MMYGFVFHVDTDTGIVLPGYPGRPSAANGGDDVGFKGTMLQLQAIYRV